LGYVARPSPPALSQWETEFTYKSLHPAGGSAHFALASLSS